MGFLFTRRWLLFLAAVAVLAYGCVWLGEWQFSRLDDRKERNAVVRANEDKPPAPVADVLAPGREVAEDDEWRQVTATGTYATEDTVIVRYRTGATLSYSLNACNAWEGYHIAFNGTKGRLEHSIVEQAFSAGATLPPGAETDTARTRIIPLRGKPEDIEPWTGTGGHGGGDRVMLSEVFGTAEPDKYKRAADERSGLYSILVGAAANRCFTTGATVKIADLVSGLSDPVVAPMPTRSGKVPMPVRV